MQIQIDTNDSKIPAVLMDASDANAGDAILLGFGIEAEYKGDNKFDIDVQWNVGTSVASDVIAIWLATKVNPKPNKLVVDGSDVEFDREKIRRAVWDALDAERASA